MKKREIEVYFNEAEWGDYDGNPRCFVLFAGILLIIAIVVIAIVV